MASFDIRPITRKDIPVIEQLAYDYNYELDAQATKRDAVKRWISSVAQETEEGRHYFWLACVEDRIVGFISFQLRANEFIQETYGFIEDLYISPASRRHKYAEKLAQAAFTELRQRGAQRMQLDVLTNNQQGLAFWQKLGFSIHHHVLSM